MRGVQLDAPGEERPGASRGALAPATRLQRRPEVGDDGVVRIVLRASLRDGQRVVECGGGPSPVDVLRDEPRGGDADVRVRRVELERCGEQAERAEAIAGALEVLRAPVEVNVRRVRAVGARATTMIVAASSRVSVGRGGARARGAPLGAPPGRVRDWAVV